MHQQIKLKTTIISSLGSLFETFDFYIFGLFALQISVALFNSESFNNSLILTFAIFSVGYLARPLGGFFWGNMGDKLGRKVPFRWTVCLIGVSSILIGFLPSYETLGVLTPLILASCRLVQGFSYGGELSAAVLLTYEQPIKYKAFFSSVVIACATFGMILASITYYLLSLILTPEQFINYSWRIAFIFGGLMMFFSYYQRRSLNETLPEMPLMEGVVGLNLLKKEKLKLFSSILIAASSAVFVSVIIVFLPTYCQKFLNIDAQTTASFGLVCVLTYATSTLFGGLIAEKMNHQNTLILGVFIAFLSLIPLAYFLVNHYFLSAMIFFVIFSFANGLINANYMCMILNQFKASERFSGLAISQNVAMAIFTGLLPLLLTYMLSKWMIILAPFYLLITLYLVALFGLFITRKMKG